MTDGQNEDPRTLAELAAEALQIQNASNLTALTRGFARAQLQISRLHPQHSTAELNGHPIAVLWASKIADLVLSADADWSLGIQDYARDWAEKVARAPAAREVLAVLAEQVVS